MAEMTEFTVEGELVLGDFQDGIHARIDGERIEALIARQLGFPSEEEFDQIISRVEALREQGLQVADGEPNVVREGIRLKIEVEVL